MRKWEISNFKVVNGEKQRDNHEYKPKHSDFEIVRREHYNKNVAVVRFKKIRPDIKLPEKATAGSAGYDIYADLNETVEIYPQSTVKIPTGFSTSFNRDYVALVYSRSGLATKQGLVVAQGTAVIDSDYRGEWFIPIHNDSNQVQTIENGDKIAQLIMQPCCKIKAVEVDELNHTKRGEGGFGSTGE